jgi:hypothetical protein
VFSAAAFLICALPLGAIHLPVDLEQVPVDRLVANLEALAKERPKDYGIQMNLGRAHSMAYAQKSETLTAARVKGSKMRSDPFPYIEPDSRYVPYRVQPTSDRAKHAAAMIHLKAAIAHFEKAIEIDPRPAIARINRGWCLEQSGDRAAAIAAYRDVIETGTSRRTMGAFVAAEATGYLIPLLDPVKDADEIASLRQQRARIESIPRPVTPIAVPLRDGLEVDAILDDFAAVRFDADGMGAKSWTWITADAAWLVYDQIGRGEIRSALQLFGSVSFWMFWDTGYDAMRALDDDCDGRLAGRELRHLALWRDANGNGVSEPGEIRSLADHDIVSLSFDHTRMDDADRTPWAAHGVTFRDGSTRPTWDVVLQPAR